LNGFGACAVAQGRDGRCPFGTIHRGRAYLDQLMRPERSINLSHQFIGYTFLPHDDYGVEGMRARPKLAACC
jgi:hypothetical protein